MKERDTMRDNVLDRIEWIDSAKYICIICVIMVHMESCTEIIKAFFTPFYLSLFFFLSGYVHKTIEFKHFMAKKIKQLMVPWFIFSMLNILFTFIVNGHTEEYIKEHGSLLESICRNFLQIRGAGDGMWFVAALFVASVPFYFVILKYTQSRNSNKCLYLIGISCLLSTISLIYTQSWLPWNNPTLPWHMQYMFQAMFFMVLGYLFKDRFEKKFDRYNTLCIRVFLLVAYSLIVYFLPTTEYIQIPIVYLFYHYISSVMGMMIIVGWCKCLQPSRYLLYIGRNTLIVFGLHSYVYRIIEKILQSKVPSVYNSILVNELYSSIFVLTFAVVVSVILIIPIYIIERCFPWVIGRKKYRRV